ncbi:MAG: hypothetical protein KGI28_07605 [Thaumarchaeota archaeon]|nr:hypothetical protein [Nitrososphaerota archaeon]
MSDEFLKVARQEIQSEIDSLKTIFLFCINDEQLYKKSVDIEKRMHNIKGLAPMMGQDKVGEIAKISDTIMKYVANHGILNGSHIMILEAVQKMDGLFNGITDIEIGNFRNKVKQTFPDILVS